MIRFYIIPFLLLLTSIVFSQETIIDIVPSDLSSGKYLKSNVSLRNTLDNDTLTLPFFDDFANAVVYPNTDFWLDKNAYINNGYPYNPLSRGVASLDILDSTGVIYPDVSWQASNVAEYLTSCPIDLNYQLVDSLYISFMYQCGGNGNIPEENDSLVLEFTTPDTVWHSVWNTAGALQADTFFLAMIPIRDEYLLKRGFQFRFKNYASVSSNYEPSYKSNADVWNIDYVYLDTARNENDTVIDDVAFISNFTSLIKNYESAPWNHFKNYASSETLDTIGFVYKNNGSNTQNINRQLIITDLYTNNQLYSNLDDSENILPFSALDYYKHIDDFIFESTSTDSALFDIKGFIKTDTTAARRPYRWNDTINYNQFFNNYYAYDDGSAEAGYGLAGQGTTGAALAYRFTPLMHDTLRGVNIFFNQVINEENINYFYLTVWEDLEGIPGDTIFQQIGVRPIYSDSINKFTHYALDRPIYIDTTFYIGWVKTNDDMLNVGYDFNRNAKDNLFVNFSGAWQASIMEGAPMIRPVFGKAILNSQPELEMLKFTVYPNPASEVLFIDANSSEPITYCLMDLNGRVLIQGEGSHSIPVSELAEGMYLLRIIVGNEQGIKRIVISR